MNEAYPVRIPVCEIINVVCTVYQVRRDELLGPRRNHYLIAPRFHAIALAIELRPDLSLLAIGRLFQRDHTTIMHARDVWARDTKWRRPDQIAAVEAILFRTAEPAVG